REERRHRGRLIEVRLGVRNRSLLFRTFAIAFIILSACSRGPRVYVVAPDGIRRVEVNVEIADEASKRATGLMYRDQLAENSGMIFVFKATQRLSFWMKNTKIPLD